MANENIEALIARLHTCYGNCDDELNEAADVLRSQAERIQALESSNGHLRDALRAQSDKIQSMALQSISDEANRERLQAKIDEQADCLKLMEAEVIAARQSQLERVRALEFDRDCHKDRAGELEAKCAELEGDARRYQWLRRRDLDTLDMGGLFVGLVPDNVVINDIDLDRAIDTFVAAQAGSKEGV